MGNRKKATQGAETTIQTRAGDISRRGHQPEDGFSAAVQPQRRRHLYQDRNLLGDPKSTITGQEYGAKVDEFRTKANKSLDKMGYEWNEQGNLVQKGDKKTASGSPPPRPTVPPIAGATGTALNRATNKWHWTDGKKDMGEVQGQ